MKPIMTYLGKVTQGVVVLPPDAVLPDGTEVRIEPLKTTEGGKTFYERYSEFVGVCHDLPEDFAENHDHYIHGTPKRSRE
ncbi:MAG: hypothetical protein AAB466_10605 [Verrucomicrobiota bacterium]